MSAIISPTPKLQFFTAGGVPLVGGHLYTYLAGSVTPLATYTDSSGTTSNPVDIVLDARGETPSGVWLGTSAYKFVLASADAPAVPIWTVDNISTQDALNALTAFEAELANSTSSTLGSSLVGYTPASGPPAGGRTVQAKLREIVSVLDFGADPTGVSDSTAALAAAAVYIASNAVRYRLVFPAGIYSYSVSPNWAIQNAVIEAAGEVRLRYTGTLNAVTIDAGAAANDLCYNLQMGRFIVECPSTAQNGVFVRSIHHSTLDFNVRGAGTAYAGLLVRFAVCTAFPNYTCSVNEEGWYTPGSPPAYGLQLSIRNAGETASYCLFNNPIIEGPNIGIQLTGTLGNVFIGGTSEGCVTYGVFANSGANQDKFFGTDFEVNGTADIYTVGAIALEFRGIDTTHSVSIGTGSNGIILDGGLHNDILIDTGALNTHLVSPRYNRFNGYVPPLTTWPTTGTMTDAGTTTFANGVRNYSTGVLWLTGTVAFTPGTILTATAATGTITVSGAKLGDTVVVSFSLATTGLATTAFVQSADTVAFYMYNLTASSVTIAAGTVKAVVTRS